MEILIGILCGLALSLFFSYGPAFFALLQNSINYGFRKGVAFEMGVNASDILIVVLMLTLLHNVDLAPILHNPWVACIGGGAMMALGVATMLRKPAKREGNRLVFENVPRGRELMVHGFALNTVNPSVWLYWISLITIISGEVDFTVGERYTFFISLLLAELAAGILKCRLASMLQNMVSAKMLTIINRVLGCILVGVGIFLIVSMIVHRRHPEMEEKEPAGNAAQIIHRIHNIGKDTAALDGDTLYLQQ